MDIIASSETAAELWRAKTTEDSEEQNQQIFHTSGPMIRLIFLFM